MNQHEKEQFLEQQLKNREFAEKMSNTREVERIDKIIGFYKGVWWR